MKVCKLVSLSVVCNYACMYVGLIYSQFVYFIKKRWKLIAEDCFKLQSEIVQHWEVHPLGNTDWYCNE